VQALAASLGAHTAGKVVIDVTSASPAGRAGICRLACVEPFGALCVYPRWTPACAPVTPPPPPSPPLSVRADPFVGFLENSPAFTTTESSCGEALAAALPGAAVFKALNTVQADFMKDPATGTTAVGSQGSV
jgi:hypothetical protein